MSGPRDADESLFCRPALVHTFHVALYLLFAPLPSSTFIHPPAFHLPFASLAHSFARSLARVRTGRQPRIEFTASSCLEKTRRFGDKPRTVSYVFSTFYDRLRFFYIPRQFLFLSPVQMSGTRPTRVSLTFIVSRATVDCSFRY